MRVAAAHLSPLWATSALNLLPAAVADLALSPSSYGWQDEDLPRPVRLDDTHPMEVAEGEVLQVDVAEPRSDYRDTRTYLSVASRRTGQVACFSIPNDYLLDVAL